jgi:hypothetical protein
MNRFFKVFATVIGIFAGIAAIIGLFYQIASHSPIVEIKTITNEKLTDLPTLDGFKAQYYYKNSEVKSLWKLNYLITNSGDEIIIGQGNKKNIINDSITFALPDNYKILDIKISNSSFPFENTFSQNKFRIKFMQWKPKETFEISIYTEQLKDSILPKLITNDREIINGKVIYSTLQRGKDIKQPIYDYLPKFFQSIVWWLGLISFGLVIIVIPIVWIGEFSKFLKYKKWAKTDLWMYDDWINTLIEQKKITKHYTPKQLPISLWSEYPYPKPALADNEFGSMSLGFIILIILTLIPLILMIKI